MKKVYDLLKSTIDKILEEYPNDYNNQIGSWNIMAVMGAFIDSYPFSAGEKKKDFDSIINYLILKCGAESAFVAQALQFSQDINTVS